MRRLTWLGFWGHPLRQPTCERRRSLDVGIRELPHGEIIMSTSVPLPKRQPPMWWNSRWSLLVVALWWSRRRPRRSVTSVCGVFGLGRRHDLPRACVGAHFNPVVTLAFALRGSVPWREVPAYVTGQVAVAMAASLAVRALIGAEAAVGATVPVGMCHGRSH